MSERQKERKRFEQQAYDAGAKAMLDGEPDLPPVRMGPTLRVHWEQGWRDQAARLQRVRTDPDPTPQDRAEDPRHFWPEGEPLPASYRRSYVPCKHCRRTQLPDGSQAVVVMNTAFDGKKVYLRCKWPECPGKGERWALRAE